MTRTEHGGDPAKRTCSTRRSSKSGRSPESRSRVGHAMRKPLPACSWIRASCTTKSKCGPDSARSGRWPNQRRAGRCSATRRNASPRCRPVVAKFQPVANSMAFPTCHPSCRAWSRKFDGDTEPPFSQVVVFRASFRNLLSILSRMSFLPCESASPFTKESSFA